MPDFIEPELDLKASLKTFKGEELPSSTHLKVEKKPAQSLWRSFITAFFTVFLAELGDKTQLATLLMSAESQAPWVVFMGAASALVTISLVGVWLGQWLASRLPPGVIETVAGASLLLISVLLLWDVVHL